MKRRFVCLRVGPARCAVPLEDVVQVLPVEQLSEAPTAAAFVDGVANLGGDVVPVVNLRRRLLPGGFAAEESSPAARAKGRIVVVRQGDGFYGLRVDAVREIAELEEENVTRGPWPAGGPDARLLLGRAGELWLLDLSRVLSSASPWQS